MSVEVAADLWRVRHGGCDVPVELIRDTSWIADPVWSQVYAALLSKDWLRCDVETGSFSLCEPKTIRSKNGNS